MTATRPDRSSDRLYGVVRAVGRFWLWFFFKRIDVRHSERVPARGPVLLCINHPNNLIDSLLVGAVLPRTVHYLATATLFRHPLLARFLTACGAIPVYRKTDDAGAGERPSAAPQRRPPADEPERGAALPRRPADSQERRANASERRADASVMGAHAQPHSTVAEESSGLGDHRDRLTGAEAPGSADRNAEMFAGCAAAFDREQLIAIYPEGTTHAESRVQRIKTGASRIALGYEHAHPGRLAVVPVGLTFEARKSFRSRVLVSFGEPVPIAAYREAYARDPVKAVDAVTTEIQWRMEHEVVHVDRIAETALVRAVEELYRADLERELAEERGLAPEEIDPFRLSRGIVDAVDHFRGTDPERVERLWQCIQGYRALLATARLRDEAVRARSAPSEPRTARRLPRALSRRIVWSWEAALGFPLFVYGALVNWLPYYLPRTLARRMAKKETDYATTRLLASVVAFPVFWGLEIAIVWRLAGFAWAAAFAVSLPLSGSIAYRYLAGAGRLSRRLRLAALLLARHQDARQLVAERRAIIAELERAKTDYLAATKGSSF